MDRRNFFKIVSTASAGVITGACGKKVERYMPLLVSDREISPGEEAWHPGVCGECEAGCGIVVRVMSGERVIERKGEQFRERIATIKKIEGNPLDPVSGGRLCARGQAAVQGLYHPDRLRGPMKRQGARGRGDFLPVAWEQALDEVAEKLRHADRTRVVYLMRPQAGTRALAVARFLQAIGAPSPVSFELADFPLERKAAQEVYGWNDLPVYDLRNATYAVGIGADFLGGWASPVFYARQFGHLRQGRPGVRGKLVQAESRFSITAQSADQWLPLRPGTELFFALALGYLLFKEKLARAPAPAQVVQAFEALDFTNAARLCGVTEKRLRQVARELGESEKPLVLAGASVPQTNSLAALKAAAWLNVLLGNAGKPGGVLPPSPDAAASRPRYANALAQIERSQVLFLDGVDPLYTLPASTGLPGKLARIETIVSVSSFPNDSAAHADLLLPDHQSLEAGAVVFPAVVAGAAVATPFVLPLYDTRSTEDVLAALAKKLSGEFVAATPKSAVEKMLPADHSWDAIVRQGGFWTEAKPTAAKALAHATLETPPPAFLGDVMQYPLHFLPYRSLQFDDGRSANLPWMQELPDPVSSAMWSLPVEIDRQTAAKLGIQTGDRVRVESPYGKLEAPAYIDPAAVPGVVSMAIGQGHQRFGRYASKRGANPISILAPAWEEATGALALGATRVRITRLGTDGGLVQFAAVDREMGPWGHR